MNSKDFSGCLLLLLLLDSFNNSFQASELQALATQLAKANYANFDTLGDAAQVGAITEAKSTILSKYTLHATTYTYNLSAVIDWGAFINAIISFIVEAFILLSVRLGLGHHSDYITVGVVMLLISGIVQRSSKKRYASSSLSRSRMALISISVC